MFTANVLPPLLITPLISVFQFMSSISCLPCPFAYALYRAQCLRHSKHLGNICWVKKFNASSYTEWFSGKTVQSGKKITIKNTDFLRDHNGKLSLSLSLILHLSMFGFIHISSAFTRIRYRSLSYSSGVYVFSVHRTSRV